MPSSDLAGARRAITALLAAAVLVACGSADDGAVPVTGVDATASEGGGTTVSTTTTPDAGTSTTTGDPADRDTSVPGPYAVGRRTVTVADPDRPGRTLTVDLWYPTDETGGAPSAYEFAPGIGFDSTVALDGPAVSEAGPFPLVVYSHGSGGMRYVASFFTEVLASHGVVVAAPDHAGNTSLDELFGTADPLGVVARNRPLDVSAVISAILDRSVAPEISRSVDRARVGVAGHSFGGHTALAIGGGFGDVPPDERVSALVLMAPASVGLSDEELAAVDIPTMVLSGTLDTITPIEPHTERVAALVSGRPLLRVDLIGATHQSFSDVCEYTVLLRRLPAVDDAIVDLVEERAGDTCGPDVLDVDEAQALVNRYAIAFLLSELTAEGDAADALDPRHAPEVVELERVG